MTLFPMEHFGRQIIVVGAGIAGLSAAYSLLRRGARSVHILEAEDFVCTQASGRNAAIFRPLEEDLLLTRYAARTAELLSELSPYATSPLLHQVGLMMLAPDAQHLEAMAHNCVEAQVEHAWLDAKAAEVRTGLALRHTGPILFSSLGGVLEPHEIGQTLQRALASLGGQVQLSDGVTQLLVDAHGCRGVRLASGRELRADAVVLAAGAATSPLTLQLGIPLPLVPLRRHLAILDTEAPLHAHAPPMWFLEPEVYFRPETGGILVSPCDERPQQAPLAQAELEALAPLAKRLKQVHPQLADARVRRHWACVRTKSVDNRPIIGEAPQLPGLYFFTGLGGFGMSCGLSASETLARCVMDDAEDLQVTPARFYSPFRGSDALESRARSA